MLVLQPKCMKLQEDRSTNGKYSQRFNMSHVQHKTCAIQLQTCRIEAMTNLPKVGFIYANCLKIGDFLLFFAETGM